MPFCLDVIGSGLIEFLVGGSRGVFLCLFWRCVLCGPSVVILSRCSGAVGCGVAMGRFFRKRPSRFAPPRPGPAAAESALSNKHACTPISQLLPFPNGYPRTPPRTRCPTTPSSPSASPCCGSSTPPTRARATQRNSLRTACFTPRGSGGEEKCLFSHGREPGSLLSLFAAAAFPQFLRLCFSAAALRGDALSALRGLPLPRFSRKRRSPLLPDLRLCVPLPSPLR